MILLKNTLQSFIELKKAVKDWENMYLISSKIDGQISFFNTWNVNQYVTNGDFICTIIPDENSKHIAKLKTPVKNSGKLKIGQKVTISLENYPETEFGLLEGKVDHISAISDKEGFYLIQVLLPHTLKTSYEKKIEFKQEMKGSAKIITEDLRLLERIFYQVNGIFN